jgi:hypothetical protein
MLTRHVWQVIRLAAVGLAFVGLAAACGPEQSPGIAAATAAQASASSAPTEADPGSAASGNAWCQSIATMVAFLKEDASLRALYGNPVPDGPARADKLHQLYADMKAKAPAGHDQDWIIYDQVYNLWADQLAAPSKTKLDQLQTLTTSDAMKTAQANLKPDVQHACPQATNIDF